MTLEPLSIVIEDLWRLSTRSEERVHRSGEFRAPEDTCRSDYLGLEESRLQRAPSVRATPNVLSRALHNFFRWNGAPLAIRRFSYSAPSRLTSRGLYRMVTH